MKIRKKLLIILIGLIVLNAGNVYACGEISSINISTGTIAKSQTVENRYIAKIPAGTEKVTIYAATDYEWVENYGPREVSTSSSVQLKVDGNACGYGIYSYVIEFQTVSNLIAENDDAETNEEETTDEEETTTTDLTLSSLEIENYDIFYSSTIYIYSLEVENEVTSLVINATPTDSANTVVISANSEDLEVGENEITISVVDTEGNTLVYYLNVTRKEALSDNNYLGSIVISGYTLNFDPSITDYTLAINKETSLDIEVTTESSLATYEILDNQSLEDGSVITIRVTAEDGSIRDYNISISKGINLEDYYIYIIIVALVIILIVLIIISKKRKKKVVAKPETMTAQTETAGVIPEPSAPVAPQEPATNAQTEAQTVTLGNETSNVQIIEPTDVQAPTDPQEPTEVFKL